MRKKILTGLISLALLCVGIIMCYTYFFAYETYGYINENLICVRFNNGKFAVKSVSTDNVSARYDAIMPLYHDGCSMAIVVVKDNLRGYISSTTGEVIFEPQFMYAWIDDPHSNLAACVNQEQKLGFVNVKTKEVVIPFKFYFDEEAFIPNGEPIYDFVFKNGMCIVPGKNAKVGLINEKGEFLLPADFDDIIDWRNENAIGFILEQYAGEENEYLYGVCDKNCDIIQPLQYNVMQRVKEHYGIVDYPSLGYIVSKNGYYGLLDTLFQEKCPIQYDDIEHVDGYNAFIIKKDSKYGVIDISSNWILPIEFDSIYVQQICEQWCHCDACVDYFVAIKNYVPQLFKLNGMLHNDFYINMEDYYTLEDMEESKEFLIKEPSSDLGSGYILYYLGEHCGVIDGTKRIVVPAKYDEIKYWGHGTFLGVLDNVAFILHDDK